MSSWSRRRKNIYASVIVIVLIGAVGVPAFLLFYHPPTCADAIKNGDEKGVDCGGSCQRLCQSDFLPPSVAWTRYEEVAVGQYNVAVYIINPNKDGVANKVPYHVTMYDGQGIPIVDMPGLVNIPPGRNTIVFLGAVNLGKRIPAKVFFEFTSAPDWHKQIDTLSSLVVGEKKYTEEAGASALTVAITNKNVHLLGRTSVYAVLYDASANAIGFSKTVIDGFEPNQTITAPFTWPIDRKGKVVSIEVLPVAE